MPLVFSGDSRIPTLGSIVSMENEARRNGGPDGGVLKFPLNPYGRLFFSHTGPIWYCII